jgi:hypothetical protein
MGKHSRYFETLDRARGAWSRFFATGVKRRPHRRSRCGLQLESLEDRYAPSITIGGTSTAAGTGLSSLTWSHTVTAGANAILIVDVAIRQSGGNETVAGVTYGGQPLARIGTAAQIGHVETEIWYLRAPALGTANVVATISGARPVVGAATDYFGVDQATPLGTFGTANAGSGSPSLTLASAPGQLVIDSLGAEGNNYPLTQGPGQSLVWTTFTGSHGNSDAVGGGSRESGAATVTMSWTTSSNQDWAIIAVSLVAAPTAVDDAYSVNENTTLTVSSPSGVLKNDQGNGPLSVDTSSISGPTHGTLTINADGSFVYTPNPNFAGTDSFTYRVNDGTQDSPPGVVTITVINHAPVLSGANNFTSILDTQANNNGDPVSTLIAGQVSDSDVNALSGIAVTGLNSNNGTWQYSTNGGTTWSNVGAVTNTSALLLRPTDRLRFVPDGVHATTPSVTFRAWDQTSGSPGSYADTSVNGGTSAFSSATATATLNVGGILSGTVFEDAGYGGGAGRSLAASGGIGIGGARVELYDSNGNLIGVTTTAVDGAYAFTGLAAGNYTVRVVDSSVASARLGYTAGLLPVQTYRTSATGGTPVPVTDHVGGENPSKVDAGNGASTLAALISSTATPESLSSIAYSSSNISGVDFGFNFDTVVNANDAGQGSLRQFLVNANALSNSGLTQAGLTAGLDNAVFMLADGTARPGMNASDPSQFTAGVASIALQSALPTITDPVVLDATRQPGYASTPLIELNGTNAGVSANGLTISASASIVRGLAIDRFAGGNGILIQSAGGDTVSACFIGTNTAGVAAANLRGIWIDSAGNNTIGGTTAAARNIISGNTKDGVYVVNVGAANNVIVGNYLGTDVTGTASVPNGHGVLILAGASNNVIGGTVAGAGNVISGNNWEGIILDGAATTGNIIEGNAIGVAADGLTPLPNLLSGVLVQNNASNNTIGAVTGGGNIIANQQNSGVIVKNGSSGISIRGNTIYGNSPLGIDLGGTGAVLANDGTKDPALANAGMDFPVFTSAILNGTSLTVTGYVGSAASQALFAGALVDIYKSDNSGTNGQGRTYLGTLTADANGNLTGTLIVAAINPGDPITATATDDSNDTSEFGTNAVVVNGTTVFLTSSTGSSTYGQAITFTATVMASGMPTGTVTFMDGATVLGTGTLSGSAASLTLTTLPAGSHTIIAVYGGDNNYATATSSGLTETVAKASLTVTADPQSRSYGAANPVLTATISGYQNGETPATSGVTGNAGLSTTAAPASHVGSYPIVTTVGSLGAANYTFTLVNGVLNVTAVSLTISADSISKVYGASMPALTASYSGFVNSDTAARLASSPSLTTAATASSHVGTYSIIASGAADPDYTISYAAGTLTVTRASLTISADNQSKAYGAALPTLSASYSGFVNGDTPANLTTAPSLGTGATQASHVGSYPIIVSGAVDNDYTITYVPGTLSITPVALTITATDQTKVYGAAMPTLTVGYGGLVNGDTPASMATTPGVTTTATAASHFGAYPITPSGAVDSDYTISYVAGTLSVTQASLTISADNQGKAYGAALPTLTPSYGGFTNGDTAASLSTLPSLTTSATAASHVGTYPITVSGAVDNDYKITYVFGTLSINPVALTITATDQTKVYGAALPGLTVGYAGLVNGDSPASFVTAPDVTTTATAASHVGTYSITASGAVDADYTIAYVAGTLSVTPAGLNIGADNQTKVYGGALPTLTASYSGFVNGDTAATLVTAPNISTLATAASHAGTYAISVSGAADSDYTITYTPGTLSITPVALIITANDQGKVYGAPLPLLTTNYAGFVNDDTATSLSTAPSIVTTATAASHVGNYPITVSGAVDADYTISYVAGTLSVTPASLTISADGQSMLYGTALPALTATITGLVNGDTALSLTAAPVLSTTATAQSPVGVYTITVAAAVDPDYNIGYVNGTLSVTAALLTITADNLSAVYGAGLPVLTASYSGFVNGDTAANLTTLPSLTTTATAASHVGSYSITASGAVDSNYTIRYVAGVLNVTPAALTITADDQSMLYGSALPGLTASYSGLVNADTATSLTIAPSLTTAATPGSHVGSYTITVTGAVDTDYTIKYVDGTLNITPAALTITADNQTKVYGTSLPQLTASYSGLVNGDSPGSLPTAPSLGTAATAQSHVGGYTISASGAADPDYTISYAPGVLSVTPAPLTIAGNQQSKVYGAALPNLRPSYSGFVNGDSVASLATAPNLTTPATAASNVGVYPITVSGAVDIDYTITYVAGTLTITQAALTITANDQIKVYGAVLPLLTATYSGLVNGDTSASLSTAPSLSTTATAASHVGSYSITARSAVDPNYAIRYVVGTLNVTPASLAITADDQVMTYGSALPNLLASYSGFVNGDSAANLASLPSLSTAATSSSHVGNYLIVASGATDTDYVITYVGGTLRITQAGLTITANNQSIIYGGALPALTARYSGFVNGDTPASLEGVPAIGTTATSASHVGSYTITVSGAADPDYTIGYVAGSLSITPASLTIAADDQSMVYGATLPTLTASYSGFLNGDTPASLGSPPSVSATAMATSHVGSYTIAASGAVDPDYAIRYVDGTLMIKPAPLTITADAERMIYGGTFPGLTTSYSGFVNGDTSANLSALPALSTSATPASHVGSFTITASGASDADYTIAYVPGSFSITPAALTITADNQTMAYGAALPTLTASYDGLVNGDTAASLTALPTVTTTATTGSHTGTYLITVSGAADPDYAIANVDGTLTITSAVLTITADNQSMVYGTVLPALTVTYSGFINGDSAASLAATPSLSTTATAASHVGNYAITPVRAVDPDYTIVYVSGTLTITPAALTISADSQTMVYGTTLPVFTASYSGFVNGDTPTSLTTRPSLNSAATAGSHVGSYSVTPSGAVDGDYSINYIGGTLRVTPARLTITADNYSAVYGAVNPTLTASFSGLVNGDTATSLTTPPALSTAEIAASHVGTYAINASGAFDPDYSIAYIDGTLTITPAALTISADNQTMTYGGVLPTLTASYSGLVNGDTAASLGTMPTVATTATTASHVGSYGISASGAIDPDYAIRYVDGVLAITPATLTITAGDQSMVYGSALPVLTASYSGFVNGDAAASLTTLPSLTTTATGMNHVGTYPIVASGAVDADYAVRYVSGTLTITPAALTIAADNQTMVYGAGMPTLTASYRGFVNNDTAASFMTPVTVSTNATVVSHVGAYAITATGAVDRDYTIEYLPGTLNITPAGLNITASSQSMVYGSALPNLTATYLGFVNGDTTAALRVLPTLGTTANATSHVGTYPITASGAVDPDYAISYVPGTLVITPALLTITADNQSMVYGAATLPALTASYVGWVNGDTPQSLSVAPTLNTSANAASHVGSYQITVSWAVDGDYTIQYVGGTLRIAPASLIIAADNQSMVYGGVLPALTASYRGLVNGDTAASLATSLTTLATGTSHVGNYEIIASGAVDPDYAISYVPGTLSVTPATMTIIANNQTIVYGTALPAFTASFVGFVNGDTVANLTTVPQVATIATGTSHVGNYLITATGAVDPDYAITYAPGILELTPADLIIAALDQTMVYGGVMPVLAVTYHGLANGDTVASLTAAPAVASAASASSHVGSYVITALGAADPDYAISYIAGTLTITPATLVATVVNTTKVYGQANPVFMVSYNGFVNQDTAAAIWPTISYSTTADGGSHVGSYTVSAAGANTGDYAISFLSGTLVVLPAPLTVTVADASRIAGEPNPDFTATYNGFVNGDDTSELAGALRFTTSAASTSLPGKYAIVASGLQSQDYAISYVDGTLIVHVPPTGLNAVPPSAPPVIVPEPPVSVESADDSRDLLVTVVADREMTSGAAAGAFEPDGAAGATQTASIDPPLTAPVPGPVEQAPAVAVTPTPPVPANPAPPIVGTIPTGVHPAPAAVLPRFAPLTTQLVAMAQPLQHADAVQRSVVVAVGSTTLAAAAGYAVMHIRVLSLVLCSLSATPLWSKLDPLAILDGWERKRRNQNRRRRSDRSDDESSEEFFE